MPAYVESVDLPLPAKAEAIYERSTRTVRCVDHASADDDQSPSSEVIDPGTPGASARREFERRRAAREQRIRDRHPKLGGLIHALSDEPQSTQAWDTGALGEEAVGRRLNELASETLRVLHDRRIPGSSANIDHIAVTPTGVYVIDPKRYRGQRPLLKVEGGLIRPRVEKLVVGSRDRTKLVDGMLKQIDVVREVLDNRTPIVGVLCFVDADWPLIGGSFRTRGVEVLWPKKLHPMLQAHGPMGPDSILEVHLMLASALPAA